jgi:hypothetical protein
VSVSLAELAYIWPSLPRESGKTSTAFGSAHRAAKRQVLLKK